MGNIFELPNIAFVLYRNLKGYPEKRKQTSYFLYGVMAPHHAMDPYQKYKKKMRMYNIEQQGLEGLEDTVRYFIVFDMLEALSLRVEMAAASFTIHGCLNFLKENRKYYPIFVTQTVIMVGSL